LLEKLKKVLTIYQKKIKNNPNVEITHREQQNTPRLRRAL
jgi:hypothetical protein